MLIPKLSPIRGDQTISQRQLSDVHNGMPKGIPKGGQYELPMELCVQKNVGISLLQQGLNTQGLNT